MGDAGFFFQDGPNVSKKGGHTNAFRRGFSKGVHLKTPDNPWIKHNPGGVNEKGSYIILKFRGDNVQVKKEVADRWVVFRHTFTVAQDWSSFLLPLCHSNRECALPPAFARDWTPAPESYRY